MPLQIIDRVHYIEERQKQQIITRRIPHVSAHRGTSAEAPGLPTLHPTLDKGNYISSDNDLLVEETESDKSVKVKDLGKEVLEGNSIDAPEIRDNTAPQNPTSFDKEMGHIEEDASNLPLRQQIIIPRRLKRATGLQSIC